MLIILGHLISSVFSQIPVTSYAPQLSYTFTLNETRVNANWGFFPRIQINVSTDNIVVTLPSPDPNYGVCGYTGQLVNFIDPLNKVYLLDFNMTYVFPGGIVGRCDAHASIQVLNGVVVPEGITQYLAPILSLQGTVGPTIACDSNLTIIPYTQVTAHAFSVMKVYTLNY